MLLVEDLELQNFVVASYSKQIIKDIYEGTSSSYGSIAREIKQQASSFNCKFTFEGRAESTEAVSLAKFSNSLHEGRLVWFHPQDPYCIPLHVIFLLIILSFLLKKLIDATDCQIGSF